MTKEIFLHKIFFDMTIRSTKTGNRTENRTPDQPEIFMDELVCQYKFTCIGIFLIGPTVLKIQTKQLLMGFITTIPLYRSRKNKFARSKRGFLVGTFFLNIRITNTKADFQFKSLQVKTNQIASFNFLKETCSIIGCSCIAKNSNL